MGATSANAKGHWESLEFYDLHDKILAEMGSRWDDDITLPAAWFEGPSAKAATEEIVNILSRDFADAPLFVIKDPRMCRLMPLWHRALDAFGARPAPLVMVRHPLEVAASLNARKPVDEKWAASIWLRHVLDAERATRGLKRAVVFYQDLLRDWRGVTQNAAHLMHITWPAAGAPETAQLIDLFLSESDRHHVIDADALDPAHSSLTAGEAFAALRRFAKDLDDNALAKTFDCLNANCLNAQ
jgi:hypothetical protein